MKVFWACILASASLFAQAQTESSQGRPAQGVEPTVADFGLAYPLSQDWVGATALMRRQIVSSGAAQGFDLLLAGVYAPLNSTLSSSSPYFTLVALQHPANDCKRYMDSMITNSQKDKGIKIEGQVTQFSAASRDYYRINVEHATGVHHRLLICTATQNHLLIWNAGAANSKGLESVLATLDAITPLPPESGSSPQTSDDLRSPQVMSVGSAITSGLLLKKVNPIYPADARHAGIQGTVIMTAEISKSGDIVNLELVSGPIELAGSAITAVRQWKYRPYMLNGQPVSVKTQVQVNYELRPR